MRDQTFANGLVYKYYGAIGLLPEESLFGCFKLNVKSNCQRFIVFERFSLKFNIPDTGIILNGRKILLILV
jgi:hypothetical protein